MDAEGRIPFIQANSNCSPRYDGCLRRIGGHMREQLRTPGSPAPATMFSARSVLAFSDPNEMSFLR
jgi:hypothetical protein